MKAKYLENVTLDEINEKYTASSVRQNAFYTERDEHEYFNFKETDWEQEFDEVLAFLEDYNVHKFTVSYEGSVLLRFLAFLVCNGCQVIGATQVYAGYTYIDDNWNIAKKYTDALIITRK